jgi:hypothetical protein
VESDGTSDEGQQKDFRITPEGEQELASIEFLDKTSQILFCGAVQLMTHRS